MVFDISMGSGSGSMIKNTLKHARSKLGLAFKILLEARASSQQTELRLQIFRLALTLSLEPNQNVSDSFLFIYFSSKSSAATF